MIRTRGKKRREIVFKFLDRITSSRNRVVFQKLSFESFFGTFDTVTDGNVLKIP